MKWNSRHEWGCNEPERTVGQLNDARGENMRAVDDEIACHLATRHVDCSHGRRGVGRDERVAKLRAERTDVRLGQRQSRSIVQRDYFVRNVLDVFLIRARERMERVRGLSPIIVKIDDH
jgi:hypothetical protein